MAKGRIVDLRVPGQYPHQMRLSEASQPSIAGALVVALAQEFVSWPEENGTEA